MTDHELRLKSIRYRRDLLRYIFHAGAGHTGGSLSCVDILNVLYNRVLRVSPRDVRRSRPRPLHAKQGALGRGAVRGAGRPRVFSRGGAGNAVPVPIAVRRPSDAQGAGHRNEHRRAGARAADLRRAWRWPAKLDGAAVSRVHAAWATANWPRAPTGRPPWPRRITSSTTSRRSSITTRCRSPAARATFAATSRSTRSFARLAGPCALSTATTLPQLTEALAAACRSRQADVRHRQHGQGPRRQLHGGRREVAPRRAQPTTSTSRRSPNWTRPKSQLAEARPMSAPAPSMFSPAAQAMAEKLGLDDGPSRISKSSPTRCWRWPKADRQHCRRHERLARFRQARPVRPGAAAAARRSRHRRAEPGRHRRRSGRCRQEVVRRFAGVLSHGPGAGANQERRLLFRRAGRDRRHQRGRELRRAGQHAPFAARPGRAAGNSQHYDHRAGRQFRNARGGASRGAAPSILCISASAKRRCTICTAHRREFRSRQGDHAARRRRRGVHRHGRNGRPRAAGRRAAWPKRGIECRVLSMHTVKPLDADAVLPAGRECRAVVTVEEHSVHGGLGEACAAMLMQAGVAVPFRIVGIARRRHGHRQPGGHLSPLRHLDGRPGAHGARLARIVAAHPQAATANLGRVTMTHVLAIDQSTSATKAVLFDAAGRVVDIAVARASPDLSAARLGRARRRGNLAERAGRVGEVAGRQRATRSSPPSGWPSRISARRSSCSTGDRAGRCTTRSSGNAAAATRSASELASGRARGIVPAQDRAQARHVFLRLQTEMAARRTAGHCASKLAERRRARRHDRHLSDLPPHRWRGVRHRSTRTPAARCCTTSARLQWDDAVVQAVRRAACVHCPKCARASPVSARRTPTACCRRKLPICGVMGDSQASLFAQRCYEPGMAKATFGSGTSVLLNVGEQFRTVDRAVPSRRLAWVLRRPADLRARRAHQLLVGDDRLAEGPTRPDSRRRRNRCACRRPSPTTAACTWCPHLPA